MEPGFEQLAREADRLLRAGQWRPALQAVKAALVVSPDWSAGSREAGGLALRLGDGARAVVDLRRAICQAPDDPRSWMLLARAAQAGSGAISSLDAGRRAIVLKPGHHHAQSFLAAALASRAENRRALTLLGRLGCIAPPSPFDLNVGLHARLALGDLSGADRTARHILTRSPVDPSAMAAMGRLSNRRRDHQGAWRYLARLGVLRGGDARTLTAMSRAALANAMFEAAARLARKALLAGADQGECYLDLARALWRLEDRDGADRAIERARLVDAKTDLRGRVLRLTVTGSTFADVFQRNSVNTPV